jgi:hypothetical protein
LCDFLDVLHTLYLKAEMVDSPRKPRCADQGEIDETIR